MKMPELQPKDVICIVAPAGALKPEDLDFTINLLNNEGYKIELAPNLFKKYFYGYNYAGTPEDRICDFQWAIDHPSAKAIWCARGGYGGVQIIDFLDWKKFQKKPKWIIGYSDNTVFHQFLTKNKIPSVHGMTVKLLNQNQSKESFNDVLEILHNNQLSYDWKPHSHNEKGKIEAPITGGNLSIIYSLMGSDTISKFKNKIVFIEDWQENWYHLDRMLMGLMRAGVFENIQGLIVGSFTKMDVKDENLDYSSEFDPYSYEIIANYFKDFKIPKAFGLSSGHIDNNRALIMGREATLKVDDKNSKLKM